MKFLMIVAERQDGSKKRVVVNRDQVGVVRLHGTVVSVYFGEHWCVDFEAPSACELMWLNRTLDALNDDGRDVVLLEWTR
jgi:hypothetical protein